jgi:hypothetical protein
MTSGTESEIANDEVDEVWSINANNEVHEICSINSNDEVDEGG